MEDELGMKKPSNRVSGNKCRWLRTFSVQVVWVDTIDSVRQAEERTLAANKQTSGRERRKREKEREVGVV